MERLDLLGFLIVTLNCNVTIVGKIWLIFTILLRMVVVVLAGAPVYQDEQERFVCNTLQPGCANVCYDIFSPVSHLRFWLIQSVSVLLPSAVFSVYVLHKGAVLAARGPCAPEVRPRGHDPSDPIAGDRRCPPPSRKACNLNVPDFSSGYMVHLFLRTLTEAAFGALHYLLFGFLVPKRFSCTRPPCTSVVDCYVSRPTEKSIMMLFLWAVSALSLLLSVADLACSARRRMRGGPAREGGAARAPRGWGRAGGRSPGPTAAAGGWAGGEGARSPTGRSALSGPMELPDEDESEAISSASDKPARPGLEPGDRPHGEAPQDPGSEGRAGSEEPPASPRSRLARRPPSSPLPPPARPRPAGSVPSRIARPTMLPGAPAGGAASRQGTGGPREPPLDPRLRETELAQVPGSPLEPRLACTRTELPDLVQRRERSAQGPCESPRSGRAGERHRECGRCTSIGSCKP
ncbi:gap junction delta-4 protein [Diceros bicornis minor]|uniref:gap junction delta-4 protein n=1 Tax=Diceros bicornis minor TaxID=77932 RepID=UPI0026E9CDB9|nr:gap junction delta-4 protein [Diceros bicornis minor]